MLTDEDYVEGRKWHPYMANINASHCARSILDPDRLDYRFKSLETIDEHQLYRENGMISTMMSKAPYNMHSSMGITIHLRARRITGARLQELGLENYS